MKELDELLFNYNRENMVKEDFEEEVFKKITRKKHVRRINYSVLSVFVLIVTFLVLQTFIPPSDKLNSFAQGSNLVDKEEIPLLEDFYFSSADETARFTLEQVSYTDDDGVIY